MSSDVPVPKRWFQFSLRTLLLLFIPVILLAGLARWLFCPPPIDVTMTVKRFYWYRNMPTEPLFLVADLAVTNRSRNTVWRMGNPRYCLLERVDGKWLASSVGCSPGWAPGRQEQDWWLPLDGTKPVTIPVGVDPKKATVIRVVVSFTTDRFMPKRHWVFSPEIKIVKKGKNYFPEVDKGAGCTESLYAPTPVSRDFENNHGKIILTSPVPIPDHTNPRLLPRPKGGRYPPGDRNWDSPK
jgi:hypothetical protein